MKRSNSIVAMIIILSILALNAGPILAMKSDTQTIYIYQAEDLHDLSKNCSYDRWSMDKQVVLKADIDLERETFTPIPIFCGSFDGNNHTIRGLSIKVEGSNQGLFRYLQEGASIKNLRVQGTVKPEGEKSYIGGIVGYNRGIIENCSFSGYVEGKDLVGGLVGWNGTSGLLMNCSSKGSVFGEHKIGGVAGYNAGTILRCSNDASVNTTVEEYKLDYKDVTIEDINISKLTPDATDIGGIAGVNSGIINNSNNHGTVGYPHVGYNVGGVAGRQMGYIDSSSNGGTVYGRRGIGGIVGKMEPHTSKLIPSSKLERLQKELKTLQGTITRMISNTKVSGDEITQDLSLVLGNLDETRGHAQSLINQTEQLINENVEEINKISLIAVEAMDRMVPIIKALTHTVKIMDRAMGPMTRALKSISAAMDKIPQIEEHFGDLSDSMESSIKTMEEVKDKVTAILPIMVEALELLQKGEILEAWDLIQDNWEDLKEIELELTELMDYFQEAGDSLMEIMKVMVDTTEDLDYSLKKMIEAMEIMERANDEIIYILDGVEGILSFIRDQPAIQFTTTDDAYQASKEELFSSMDTMSHSLSKFIDTVSIRGEIIMDDMQSINDQLFLVMDLMLEIVIDISSQGMDLQDIVRDISHEDLANSREGKVSNCSNSGIIEGDINVGGITGAMSIELKLEAEGDSDIGKQPFINARYETRALVYECVNSGRVIAKKNGAGGIVGGMDLGYIHGCIGTGPVESSDGNYVGGIAGKAYGPINTSYAKCSLDGGNYVGGIAGYGFEISGCYTLVKVGKSRACVGAIAGDMEEEGLLKENYFVSSTLAGIDGISYMDKAEPIDYEKLVSIEGIPPIFKQFKLEFWAEDELIDSLDINYGDSISQDELPEIPAKEGYYSKWEEFDTRNIRFDSQVKAVYTPYLTVLESQEKRNGSLAIVLVGGEFTEDDSLILTEEDNPDILLAKRESLLEQWQLTIPQDGNRVHTIRYLPPSKKGSLIVYLLADGKWTQPPARWDGRYLVFEAEGDKVTFAIVDKGISYINYLLLLGGILLIVGIIIYYIRYLRK